VTVALDPQWRQIDAECEFEDLVIDRKDLGKESFQTTDLTDLPTAIEKPIKYFTGILHLKASKEIRNICQTLN